MEIFTYQDYLKYQKLLEGQREAIVNILREDEETYKLSNERINNDHDKVFRSVLDDKREVAKFINKMLKLEIPIMEEEVEKLIKSLKEGEKPMLAVLEMLEEENKKIFRKGERKGEKRGKEMAKLETARRLLEEKVPIKIIIKVTELSEEEINKLKN